MKINVHPIVSFMGLAIITYPYHKRIEKEYYKEIAKAFSEDEKLYWAIDKIPGVKEKINYDVVGNKANASSNYKNIVSQNKVIYEE